MKNLTKLFGLIAFIAIMIFTIVACDNDTTPPPSGGIPSKWHGGYGFGPNPEGSYTIGATTATYKSGDLVVTYNISYESGGTISKDGNITGEWIYLLFEGQRNAILMENIEMDNGLHIAIATCADGVNNFLQQCSEWRGYSFSPTPNTAGFQETGGILGERQWGF
ncbi:MAG: hypothetical protein LBC51_02040 [Treponema sp.]|jgi:hypothetical protein|nr:hypothetical protein [Treponema sp.]